MRTETEFICDTVHPHQNFLKNGIALQETEKVARREQNRPLQLSYIPKAFHDLKM
jgi:hypothetical protein